jgi:hypothetical protein
LAFLWAAPAFCWWAQAPWWATALCAALPILLTGPMVGMWRRRGRAENWVLALYRDGIWLNLRDCDYLDAPSGTSVVFVPYGEIASARRYFHRYTTPSSDNGDTLHKDVYLELQLQSANIDEVRQALDEERRLQPPTRSYFHGVVTMSTKRTQFPVELEPDGRLRVKFTVSSYGLRPSLKKVLAKLQQFVDVEADAASQLADWNKLDGAESDELVRRLVKNGQQIDAIRLLKERKGLSTSEANRLVDELEPSIAPIDLEADSQSVQN